MATPIALVESVVAQLHALGCPWASALTEHTLCGVERYRTLEWLVTRYSPAVVELCTERDFQPAAEPDRVKRLMAVCTAIGVCSADDEPVIRGERSRVELLECMQQLCTLIATAAELHVEPRVATTTEWERSGRLLSIIAANALQAVQQPSASTTATDTKDGAAAGGSGGVFSDECVLFPPHIQHLPNAALYASVVPAGAEASASARATAASATASVAVATAVNASMASSNGSGVNNHSHSLQSYAHVVWPAATSDNRTLDAQLHQLEQHIASTERAIAALHTAHPSLVGVDGNSSVTHASEADPPFGATELGTALDGVLARLVRATTSFNAVYTGTLEPAVTGYVTCAEWHPHAAVPVPSSLLSHADDGKAGSAAAGGAGAGATERKQPPATPHGPAPNGTSGAAVEPMSPDPFQTPVRNTRFKVPPSGVSGSTGNSRASVAAVNLHSGLSDSVVSVHDLHGTLRAVGGALRTLRDEYTRVGAAVAVGAGAGAGAPAAASAASVSASVSAPATLHVRERLSALACDALTDSACGAMDDTIRVLQQAKARRRALNQSNH